MQLTVPPTVTQNLARTKSLLERNEPVRALEAFTAAVNSVATAQVVGRARTALERSLQECVEACNSHAKIRSLIRELTKSETAALAYTPGEETRLASVVTLLCNALIKIENAGRKVEEEKAREHKEARFETARAAIRNGEVPKGRALLRKLGEEYGAEPGVLGMIGDILTAARFPLDAVPYLERAVADFPQESRGYATLASCYLELREFEKAEKLYLAAIREFGMHPRTLANLGKLYIQWNKRDKAFDILRQAVRLAPDDKEIAELFAKVDR